MSQDSVIFIINSLAVITVTLLAIGFGMLFLLEKRSQEDEIILEAHRRARMKTKASSS